MSQHLLSSLGRSFRKQVGKRKTPKSRYCGKRLRYESLESRELMAVAALQDLSVSEDTGEKPQSKLWEYAGQWWTVMPNDSGTWVHRLDGTNWTPTVQISSNDGVRADVKSIGDMAHVLLLDGNPSQLASLQYNSSTNRFESWSLRPQLVNVPLNSSVEMATIDIDSKNRMWVAYDVSSTIEVRYSDLSSNYTTWSAPITVATGITSDDICVITAMPGATPSSDDNSIGVMWSNQSSKRFGFRYHLDSAAPASWSTAETAAAQSASGSMADDHLNVAVHSNGTMYVAAKTSYSGSPTIILLVRRPNGSWDNMYSVDGSGTRPIVVLDEAANSIVVAYTTSDSGGDIVYRVSPADVISFAPRQVLIDGNVNDVTSTKQSTTGDIVFLASDGGEAQGAKYTFDAIIPQNLPPTVFAGSDQNVSFPTTVFLDGTVSDDGFPSAGTLITTWSRFSGPTGVTFNNPSAVDTFVNFASAGTYVLRLTASDGQRTTTDDVQIIVAPEEVDELPLPPPPPPVDQPTQIAFQDGLFPAVTYAGTRDTKINSGSKTKNYGTATEIKVDGSPDEASLFRWDVSAIPVGSVIVSAAIELNAISGTNGNFEVYALQRAWDEISATWNQHSSSGNWATAGANGAADHSSSVLGQFAPTAKGINRITLNDEGIDAVQSWVNNAATNFGIILKDYTVSDGVSLSSSEASTASLRPKLIINYSFDTIVTNLAPLINAGPDQALPSGSSASLDGSVSDDGQPSGSTLLSTWAKVSGPGTVTFANSSAVDTTATFSASGDYVLRLTASDGQQSSFDEVAISIAAEVITNSAPLVNAGADQALPFGSLASLDGSVSDDGQPSGSTLLSTWTKVSGPGTVTFANSSAVDTTASFSASGDYVLRLTASDGQQSSFDEVAISIAAEVINDPVIPPPLPPVSNDPFQIAFQDGLFPSVAYAGTRDTKLNSGSMSKNYGTSTEVKVDGSPDEASLFRWDVSAIPADSVVVSAAIELNAVSSTDGDYEVYALQRAWDEMSATWNQFASGQNWGTAGASGAADHSSTVLGQFAPSGKGIYRIALNDAGVAAVQSWVNNAAANFGVILKDYAVSDGVSISSSEASNNVQRPKLIINYAATSPAAVDEAFSATVEEPVNQPPTVNGGVDLTVQLGQSLNLSGIVSDDGLPSSSLLTVLWTRVSGPGTVTFASSASASTSAQFSAAGTYVLRLSAGDGELESTDELTVTVTQPVETPVSTPTTRRRRR